MKSLTLNEVTVEFKWKLLIIDITEDYLFDRSENKIVMYLASSDRHKDVKYLKKNRPLTPKRKSKTLFVNLYHEDIIYLG